MGQLICKKYTHTHTHTHTHTGRATFLSELPRVCQPGAQPCNQSTDARDFIVQRCQRIKLDTHNKQICPKQDNLKQDTKPHTQPIAHLWPSTPKEWKGWYLFCSINGPMGGTANIRIGRCWIALCSTPPRCLPAQVYTYLGYLPRGVYYALFLRRYITMVTYAGNQTWTGGGFQLRLSDWIGFLKPSASFGTDPIPWRCLRIFFMRHTGSHQRVFFMRDTGSHQRVFFMRDTGSHQRVFFMRDTGSHQRVFFMRDTGSHQRVFFMRDTGSHQRVFFMRDTGSHQRVFFMRDTGSHQRVFFMRDTGSHQRVFFMRDTGSHQRVFFMRDTGSHQRVSFMRDTGSHQRVFAI